MNDDVCSPLHLGNPDAREGGDWLCVCCWCLQNSKGMREEIRKIEREEKRERYGRGFKEK